MTKKICIIDDEQVIRETLSEMLRIEGYEVVTCDNGLSALDTLSSEECDLVLCDIRLPDVDGLDLLEKIRAKLPGIMFIMMTAFGSVESAVEAMKLGAQDFITKPFLFDDVKLRIKRIFEFQSMARKTEILQEQLEDKYSLSGMIGKSEAMQHVFRLIRKVSAVDSTVLITGESGTGKELTARAIHFTSTKKDKRFVAVNCGAIPASLLESELFGYKKGSFTDAKQDKEGIFLYANGGSIFLDEITELPYNLQSKLLRVIEEREVRQIGAHKPEPVDFRLITASNKDIVKCVDRGEFRRDLYYRINVFNIHLPPLRERKEDVPHLVMFLTKKICKKLKIKEKRVAPSFVKQIMTQEWPGNVRELENALEQSIVLSSGDMLTHTDLISERTQIKDSMLSTFEQSIPDGGLKEMVRQSEKEYILKVLDQVSDIKEAMNILKLTKTTFYRKLKEHDINLKEMAKYSQSWEE
ncbi:MAG: sigma-54-dependent Fis family transcriptional regulator [Candidatus Omnitrophica bacterium]|nr:sigma-54-dependent Fis family transcriptional regulator [Candidatus Omnitrophota bacterium]